MSQLPHRLMIDTAKEAADWFRTRGLADRIALETTSPLGRDMVARYAREGFEQGALWGAAYVVGKVNGGAAPLLLLAPPEAPRERQAQGKEGPAWADMEPSKQAAIRCAQPDFQKFLNVADKDSAALDIRTRCGVESRADLNTNDHAAAIWRQIEADFQDWRRA